MAEESQDKSQKTEQPTAQRLKKAREEGQIALSKEVGHWFILGTFMLCLVYVIPTSLNGLISMLSYFFDSAAQISLSSQNLHHLLIDNSINLLKVLGLPFLALILAALVGSGIQTGLRVSSKPLQPKLSKISPIEGFKRLFGTKALMEFLKSFLKMCVVIVISYVAMKPEFDKLYVLPKMTLHGLLQELSDSLLFLLTIVLSSMFIVVVLDYAWQKYQFIQNLKMTKQEVKEEFKEMEGDPHLKAKIRQIREERAKNRMMADVPKAAAILMNPTHYAVAIAYEKDSPDPPVVLAKGQDHIAFKIRDVGKEHDIPIIQNPPLTRALYKNVNIGQSIPRAYFEAVARVIRYVMGLDTFYKNHLDDELDPVDLAR